MGSREVDDAVNIAVRSLANFITPYAASVFWILRQIGISPSVPHGSRREPKGAEVNLIKGRADVLSLKNDAGGNVAIFVAYKQCSSRHKPAMMNCPTSEHKYIATHADERGFLSSLVATTTYMTTRCPCS